MHFVKFRKKCTYVFNPDIMEDIRKYFESIQYALPSEKAYYIGFYESYILKYVDFQHEKFFLKRLYLKHELKNFKIKRLTDEKFKKAEMKILAFNPEKSHFLIPLDSLIKNNGDPYFSMGLLIPEKKKV